MGFLGGSVVKIPSANRYRRCRRCGLEPGSERSLGGGNGTPLQHSHLENPWTEEPGGNTVHGGHKELDTSEQLSTHTHTHTIMVCRVHHGYVLQTSHLMPITSLRWWKRITFPSWPSNRLREDVTCLASHHWKAWTQNQFFLLGVPCFLLYLTHDASLILKTYVFLLNFHFIIVMMMIVALY